MHRWTRSTELVPDPEIAIVRSAAYAFLSGPAVLAGSVAEILSLVSIAAA